MYFYFNYTDYRRRGMENQRNRSWALLIGVTLGIFLVAIIPVHAAPVTVPVGLAPGDTYRLAFVTRIPTHAESPYIEYYDDFVTSQADNLTTQVSGQNVRWSALVSTMYNPDAAFNTDTQVHDGPPIYNTHGDLIATDNDDLWQVPLISPIQYDQYGEELHDLVWTGFFPIGGGPLYQLGGYRPNLGLSTSVSTEWALYTDEWPGHHFPVYAISSTLEVVPVPAAIWLFGSGLVALLGLRRKGRKT